MYVQYSIGNFYIHASFQEYFPIVDAVGVFV